MTNSNAWKVVGDLEELKALLVEIEQERRLIKLHAYHGTDTVEIYKAANRQREALEKLKMQIDRTYRKALKRARK